MGKPDRITMSDLQKVGKFIDKKIGGQERPVIGFYGQPSQALIDIFRFNGFSFIDLDVPSGAPDCGLVPEVYCYIIREVINNAVKFRDKLRLVLCTTGTDKCDQGRMTKNIIDRLGLITIEASNCQKTPIRPLLISTARAPLKERITRIMELCYRPLTLEEIDYYKSRQCQPKVNFHGVPPRDTSILDLFPEETYIQGWTRLVELGIPSRVDLEFDVDNDAPTIYFTQSFCHKALMANFLAEKNGGLHIDIHGSATNSVQIKLDAFLNLKVDKEKHIQKSINQNSVKQTGKRTA